MSQHDVDHDDPSELVIHLMGMTGRDPDECLTALVGTDYNLEAALGLLQRPAPTSSTTAPASSSSSSSMARLPQQQHSREGGGGSARPVPPPRRDYLDDDGTGGRGASEDSLDDIGFVTPQHYGSLTGGPDTYYGGPTSASSSSSWRPPPAPQFANDDATLRNIVGFQRPSWVSQSEDLAAVFTSAQQTPRWILLVFLKKADFLSGCVNRDLWANDTIASVARMNFVVWHVFEDSTLGQDLRQRYKSTIGAKFALPAFVFVNSFTREAVKAVDVSVLRTRSGGALDPQVLLDVMWNLVETQGVPAATATGTSMGGLVAQSLPSTHPARAGAGATATRTTTTAPATVVHDVDDDPELLAALAMSEADGDVTIVEKPASTSVEPAGPEDASPPPPPRDFERELLEYDATAGGGSTTACIRLRLKLPGGSVETLSLRHDTPWDIFSGAVLQKSERERASSGGGGAVAAVAARGTAIEFIVGFPPVKLPFTTASEQPWLVLGEAPQIKSGCVIVTQWL